MAVPGVSFRLAGVADASVLAELNHRLIRDEGHRNRMTVPELRDRMAGWLRGEYQAAAIEAGGVAIGYALFRREPEFVYLRQFYVAADHRRRGLGRAAIAWLRETAWAGVPRIRIDVLIGNEAGIAFWRAVGFRDYCLTMEWEP